MKEWIYWYIILLSFCNNFFCILICVQEFLISIGFLFCLRHLTSIQIILASTNASASLGPIFINLSILLYFSMRFGLFRIVVSFSPTTAKSGCAITYLFSSAAAISSFISMTAALDASAKFSSPYLAYFSC